NPSFNPSFKIIGPFATLVKTDHPTFRWTELSGATSYTVSVFDADLHPIEMSPPLTDTQWRISDRLEAGIKYTWIVTATRDGKEVVAPALPARAEFKVILESEFINLNRTVSRTASHAARAVLYAKAGLLEEAEKEFETHLAIYRNDERVRT